MERSMLEGWLALAAETRRVDRLSSSLGLDSPAFRNSPSSLGSSRGSSGLNTPSQNAFRFLPFLNDISPELLKSSSFDFARPSPPLSRERSSHSQRNGQGPPQVQIQSRRHITRSRASSDVVDSPSHPDWKSAKSPRVHPYHTGHPHGTSSVHVPRPSLHSNRHQSYPAWPAPKPAPLSSNFTVNASPSTSSSIYGAPVSPPGYSRNMIGSRYADRGTATEYDFGHAITDSISPMLSEPFHRLIVKDEEDFIDLSNVPSSSQVNSTEMNAVPEEGDEASSWWHDDSRDMPFEFEAVTEYQTTNMHQNSLGRPWIPPKNDFNAS